MQKALTIIIFLGLFLVIGVIGLYTPLLGPSLKQLEQKIAEKTNTELRASGQSEWATLEVEGQKVSIIGIAPNEEARKIAVASIEKAMGSSGLLKGGVTIVDVEQLSTYIGPPIALPYRFRVNYEGEYIRVADHVPTENMRNQVRAVAEKVFPGREYFDNTVLAGGVPSQDWPEMIFATINVVAPLDSALIITEDKIIKISGRTRNNDAAQLSLYRLEEIPEGYEVSINLDVAGRRIKNLDQSLTRFSGTDLSSGINSSFDLQTEGINRRRIEPFNTPEIPSPAQNLNDNVILEAPRNKNKSNDNSSQTSAPQTPAKEANNVEASIPTVSSQPTKTYKRDASLRSGRTLSENQKTNIDSTQSITLNSEGKKTLTSPSKKPRSFSKPVNSSASTNSGPTKQKSPMLPPRPEPIDRPIIDRTATDRLVKQSNEILARSPRLKKHNQLASTIPSAWAAYWPVTQKGKNVKLAQCQNEITTIMHHSAVKFVPGTSQITPASRPILAAVASTATRCARYKLEILSYVQDLEKDYELSAQQTGAVSFFLQKRGIRGSRLRVTSLKKNNNTQTDKNYQILINLREDV